VVGYKVQFLDVYSNSRWLTLFLCLTTPTVGVSHSAFDQALLLTNGMVRRLCPGELGYKRGADDTSPWRSIRSALILAKRVFLGIISSHSGGHSDIGMMVGLADALMYQQKHKKPLSRRVAATRA